MRTSLLQITSSDEPAENLSHILGLAEDAVADGAEFLLTPEVSNCLTSSRARQVEVLRHEENDPTLASLQDFAARRGVWLSIGSLALKTTASDGRFANRSFLISPDGEIAARYDKLHMFDVAVSKTETYRESANYRPGEVAVLAGTPFAKIGLTICYDLRFPGLFRDLAKAGAEVILVPAAFSPVTGAAHWEPLLRARAIETGTWIVAAAQTGTHPTREGPTRQTHGHSLAVNPWGEVVADAGTAPGIVTFTLDLAQVSDARRKIPSLQAGVSYSGPT
ncbi:carbon-nitrogen hydrolase family protein [Tropicimonas sp. S265A]|uniref:carbon-nitrogen hydrolase family protein n=1 Tax=Tropicimonas sp. S265A TaxID=3415134 RepID=UPI003C7AAEED